MKHGLFLPAFDGLADAAKMADLAVLAEEEGWDGFFVWDHIRYPATVRDILDPYVCLALMAAQTSRIILGPMVTPLIRRRPQVLARQAVTLDRGERVQIRAELESAVTQAAREAPIETVAIASEYARLR